MASSTKKQVDQKFSVFGGTGFIGSRFCDLYPDLTEIVNRDAFKARTNSILYFISTVDNYNVFTNPLIDIETNLIVLLKVLEEFKKTGGVFNFISSWFVYGDTDLPARGDSVCFPKGFYSITKKAAEDLLVSYCKTFGLDYRILRLSNVYGVGDQGVSKKKNALQYLINNLKNNEAIDLYDGGDVIRDYLHIDDVCRAIELISTKGDLNTVFNVGSGKPHRIKDIVHVAYSELNSKSEIHSIQPPEFHRLVQVQNMYLDISKLKALGFQQEITIEAGIRELCQKI